MVLEGECPPEEEIPAAPTPVPTVIVRPAPAVPTATPFVSLAGLIDILREIFAFIRAGSPVVIKAARRSDIQQYSISDATKFSRITTIPADALQWELWNSDLGVGTGVLDWAYVADPGTVGSGNFNRLALNQRASRALAGVDLYVRPATSGQVAVLEVLRL